MKRVDGIVGTTNDPDLAAEIEAHEAAGTLEAVVLDSADRRKSRLRVETDAGTDLGILVDKPELSAGDILLLDDDRAVVVEFQPREAFVIELPEAAESTSAESTLATTVELGHRIGNQHWDIAIEERTVYVPVEADRAIIEDVLGPYLPAGAQTWYETVDADRFVDDEDETDHSHSSDHKHGSDHGHDHGEDGDHGHSHENDSDHSHEVPHQHD